jgi:RNA polymerase sigma-70 factor, ECF subfamily
MAAASHVEEHRPRFETSRTEQEALAARFFDAVEEGDMEGLVELLAADAVVVGDGGGTSPSWRRPILGRGRVVRLFLGIGRHSRAPGVEVRRTRVNGQPGAIFHAPSGELMYVMVLEIDGGAVHTVRSVINPEKLHHLGPLADVGALMRRKHGDPDGTGTVG